MAGILIVLLFVATGIVAVVFLFYLSYLAVIWCGNNSITAP